MSLHPNHLCREAAGRRSVPLSVGDAALQVHLSGCNRDIFKLTSINGFTCGDNERREEPSKSLFINTSAYDFHVLNSLSVTGLAFVPITVLTTVLSR